MIKKVKVIQDANEREKYFEKFGESEETKDVLNQFFKVRFLLENQDLGYYVDENNTITFEEFKNLINEALEKQKQAKQPKKSFVSQGKINKDKFVELYGEEAYNQFIDLKKFLKAPYDDINYWFKVLKQIENLDEITAKRVINASKEELNEILIDAEEKKEMAESLARANQVSTTETEEERLAREKNEEEVFKNNEANNPSKIVEGEGIEYLGGNAEWRVYKVTTPEGSSKFALPRSQGKGWCITGGGKWGRGDATKGITDVSAARSYWVSSYVPFYFFMTEPMNKSYAFYKSGDKWTWVDAKTDSPVAIDPNVPLWLPFLPKGLQDLATVKPEIIEEFTILNGTLSSVNNKSLTQYRVPAAVTHIGNGAFNGCSRMKEVILPTPTTSIGTYAFEGCSKLELVEIKGKLINVEAGAFKNCSSLRAINCSDLKIIQTETFANCSKLLSIKTSEALEHIKAEAFSGCLSLNSIFVPSDCKIEDTSFNYCTKLTIFTDAPEKPSFWNAEAIEKVHQVKYGVHDSINDIAVDTLMEVVKKFKKEHSDIINKYQARLDESKDKYEDYQILCEFWEECRNTIDYEDEDFWDMYMDANAMSPMPESAQKQFTIRVLNIKHLKPLTDLAIDEAFE